MGYFLDWNTVPTEDFEKAKDGSRAYEGVGVVGVYKQFGDIPASYGNELIFSWDQSKGYWHHNDKTVFMIAEEMGLL